MRLFCQLFSFALILLGCALPSCAHAEQATPSSLSPSASSGTVGVAGVQAGFHASLLIPSLAPCEVSALLVDHQGFLWIGTTEGLFCYDGYTLAERVTSTAGRAMMPSNHILSLAETPGNQLWIGTADGLVRMDLVTGRLRRYELPKKSQQLIYTLFAAKDGTLYVGTDDGMSIYDSGTDSFFNYNDRNTYVTNPEGRREKQWGYSVKSFCELPDGELLLGTWSSGLFRFNPKKRTFRSYRQLNSMNSAFSVCTDYKGRVWIGTWKDGVVRIDRADDYRLSTLRTMAAPSKDFSSVQALSTSDDGKLVWACTDGGLRLMGEQGLISDFSEMDGLRITHASKLALTGSGLLIAATAQGRVVSIRQRLTGFRSISDYRLSGTNCIFTADGRHLLLGNGSQGLALMDMLTGTMRFNGQIPIFSTINEGNINTTITTFLHRPDGSLWMGAIGTGIIVSHLDGSFRIIDWQSMPALMDNVSHLYEDRQGRVWIGMRQGVSVVFPNGRSVHLNVKRDDLDMTGYWLVSHILQDRDDRIWVGTKNDGLVRIDLPADRVEFAPAALRYTHYKAPANVTECFEDSRGRLWVVSSTEGLLLYNAQEDKFVPFDHQLNLMGKKICGICEDAQGALWVCTSSSLVRMVYQDSLQNVMTFTSDDGLPTAAFMPAATFRYGNQLFFGTTEGVVEVPDTRLVSQLQMENDRALSSRSERGDSLLLPALCITDLTIDGTPLGEMDSAQAAAVSSALPAYTRRVKLSPSVRRLTVDMALLNYSHMDATQYAYWLEGYDDDWQPLPAGRHSVTFNRLPAGVYQLHLRAMDSQGHLTQLPYTLTVKVLAPWYFRWWALLAYVLIAVLLVRFIIQYLSMRHEVLASRRFTAMSRSMLPDTAADSIAPDAQFLADAKKLVAEHLSDADYNRDRLAADLSMSVTSLYSRLRDVTGLSIQTFIQNQRLNAAADILRRQPAIRIQELAFKVGFNTPKYFSQCFKKEFGMLPKEFVMQLDNGAAVGHSAG